MFTKPVTLIGLGFALLLTVGILTGLQGAAPVQAQTSPEPSAPACLTCHENQYYTQDAGRWYCITEASDRCINCHEGEASALTEVEAHVGLVANPFGDGGQRCQECHGEDTQAYIQEVSSHTGYHEYLAVEAYVPHASTPAEGSTLLASLDQPEAIFWFIPATAALFLLCLFLILRSGKS